MSEQQDLFHDLLNKLTIIDGKIKRIKKNAPDDLQIDLDKVVGSSKAAISIVTKLKEISKS